MISVDNVCRYHTFIVDYKKYSEENPQCPKLETLKPLFRRSLYTIGLLLKHFNLKDETVRCGLQVSLITIPSLPPPSLSLMPVL